MDVVQLLGNIEQAASVLACHDFVYSFCQGIPMPAIQAFCRWITKQDTIKVRQEPSRLPGCPGFPWGGRLPQ
jgi:hypothetical protein